MKESRKEFIVRAHESACSDWKSKIETEFPKIFLKSKLVVGNWYKTSNATADYLINITELVFHKYGKGSISQKHYGFKDGEFKKGSWANTSFSNSLIAATDKEVAKALFAEANKIGYKTGDTIVSFMGIGKERIWSDSFQYLNGKVYIGGSCVFYNGEWATIIPPIKQMTLKQVQKELGYEIEIIRTNGKWVVNDKKYNDLTLTEKYFLNEFFYDNKLKTV